MKRQKGQAAVETSLMIMFIFIGIVVVAVDGFPFFLNHMLAKEASARGARAGTIFTADSSGRSCLSDVTDAVGDIPFLSATWSLSVSNNCTSDPFMTMVPGETVTVTIEATYTPLFLGGVGWPPPETKHTIPITQLTVDQVR